MTLEDQIARKKELEQKRLEIEREIQDIQTKQKRPVIASIVDSLIEFDIDLGEVQQALQQRTGIRTTGRKLGPAPAKYRNPHTGATWTGRGKAPRWLTDLEQSGKTRDDFLI